MPNAIREPMRVDSAYAARLTSIAYMGNLPFNNSD